MRKRRVYYYTLLFFMTTVLLSVSTYAWFTHNRIVTVRNIDIHVRASGGIEISADAVNWGNIIGPDDISAVHKEEYPTSVNQIPNGMEPMSTGKEIDTSTGFLKMYYGTAESNALGINVLESNRSIEQEGHGEESNGKFIAFDLFFKNYNDTDLYLTPNSNVTYRENSNEKGIAASTRIAFLLQGTLPKETNPKVIQNLKSASENKTYIWEPNYDVHTDAAVLHAKKVYGITIPKVGGQKVLYDGIISEFNYTSNVSVENANQNKYPNYFKRVNIDYYTEKSFNKNQRMFRMPQGITKVRIYMWIEGQDVDCEDNASYDDIIFNLQFTINPS